MSSWKCLLYALVCCLSSHTFKWSVGVVFIGPNTKLAVGDKLLLSAAHWTVRCPCLVRLAVGLTLQVIVGVQAFYTRQSRLHTGKSGGLLSIVPPRTSRWATVPWCTGQSGVPPDNQVLQTRQSAMATLCFLDFTWSSQCLLLRGCFTWSSMPWSK
jgi:hypothetical protein